MQRRGASACGVCTERPWEVHADAQEACVATCWVLRRSPWLEQEKLFLCGVQGYTGHPAAYEGGWAFLCGACALPKTSGLVSLSNLRIREKDLSTQ